MSHIQKTTEDVADVALDQRRIQGGGRSPLLKPTKINLFTIIMQNSENNIHYIWPFCRPLLLSRQCCELVRHLSYSREAVTELD